MNALNDIILGCINGNNLMQRELYNIYSPRFNALCHRYISNDDIAQDIFIDGFATVFNTMNQYRGEGSFEGWMHRIFMGRIINYYRNKKKHEYTSIDEIKDFDIPSEEDVEEQYSIRELLLKVMKNLTDNERVLLNMVAVEGYTFREAAEIFAVPESTIKTRYYRICATLKKKIEVLDK